MEVQITIRDPSRDLRFAERAAKAVPSPTLMPAVGEDYSRPKSSKSARSMRTKISGLMSRDRMPCALRAASYGLPDSKAC
jgi:hypothetical protein